MNTPALRNDLRTAARVLANNSKVCEQARDIGDDAHKYNADRLEQLSIECFEGAVAEYLRAISGAKHAGWV